MALGREHVQIDAGGTTRCRGHGPDQRAHGNTTVDHGTEFISVVLQQWGLVELPLFGIHPIVRNRGVCHAQVKVRKRYLKEFRRQMVELHRAGRTLSDLSRQFGPTPWAIARWVSKIVTKAWVTAD